jgi:hypothetical protein
MNDALGAPHVGDRPEKQLIAAFCDKIAELSPAYARTEPLALDQFRTCPIRTKHHALDSEHE